MGQSMPPTVVLLLSVCMLLELCFGRLAIPDLSQEDLPNICNDDNLCINGKCIPSDSDRRYDCECDVGFLFNKETGKCEGEGTVNTSGCSYSSPTKNCEEFQLQCNTGQRIQILDAGYGKVEQSSSSSGSVTNFYKESERLNCKSTDILRPCEWSSTDTQYNTSQRYDLSKTCSWKPSCQPPSLGPDIAHSISHRCVPEEPSTPMCREAMVTGELINIIFNGSAIRPSVATQEQPTYISQCVCDIKSRSSFQLMAADIRLVDSNDRCLSNTTLSGISKGNLTCWSDRETIDAVEMLTTKTTIQLSFDIPPAFIWIMLRARTEDANQQQPVSNITVKCHPPKNLKPPSTTTSTDKTSSYETKTTTTTTTTTGKTETTTTSSTTTGISDTKTSNQTTSTNPTTESTSTSLANNDGYGQSMKEQRDKERGGVPLPAIIVPIVVILVVIVVVASIFIWRRRLLKHKKDVTDGEIKVTYQVPTTNGQISHYESATPNMTDDNYLVLEQEHVYNTIASEHNKSATINSKDVCTEQNNVYQTPEPRNNNASGINEENAYTPLNAATIDRVDNIVPNVTTTLQNMPPAQVNDYFTLEPQISSRTPVDAQDTPNINGPDHIDPNKGATLQDIPPTQSNEYFILEPQKTVPSGNPEGSPDTNKNNPNHKGKPETETSQSIPATQTNDYFVLEPQNTAPSGNPASVQDTNIENLENRSAGDRSADKVNDDDAGHDYFILEAQSSPSPDDNLGGEMVDNSRLPENQHCEENHDYFTLEPNELKEK